ncbi:hypothetical protein Pfo_017609 [Paulownia fortunei]|nr:hypothetical protein Pfo_017609 [Paulownia fortunei]
MESNYQEESINWCGEVDQAEQESNDLGVGRSYECEFCKRGFNTAQALGGHMNIHRRDRARNKPTSTNSNKQEENHFGPRFYHLIPASSYNQSVNHHFVHHDHQPSLSFSTYFPASTSSTRPLYRSHLLDQRYCSNEFDRHQQQPENQLTHDDWRMSLDLDYTPTILEDLEKNRQVVMSQKEELDLELRLGNDS